MWVWVGQLARVFFNVVVVPKILLLSAQCLLMDSVRECGDDSDTGG